MKPRTYRLEIETLEDRCVPSTLAYGDFNHDGLIDMAAITSPTTITVKLANPDGSYTESASLTVKNNQSLSDIGVRDVNGDGNLDVLASSPANGGGSITTHGWAAATAPSAP